jgi:cell division protein FtsI (penicillin-binding protein 3)/stage V sporulation protein D (sporulation-specific penicillin-binding protein)
MHAKQVTEITEDQEMRSKDRARFVLSLWLLFGFVMLGRAFYIQVIQHTHYIKISSNQYISSTPVNFDRGSIYFSNFKSTPVPAAQLRTTYRIAIDPTQITDQEGLYTKLSVFIPLDKAVFMEKATKKNDSYEEIAKDITNDVVVLMRLKKLKGVAYLKDNKRAYTQDTIGSKVIGFVGNNGVRVKGQYGLERYYDDVLTRDSSDKSINFFAELFTDIEKTIVTNTDKQQGDIVLTIDAEAERVLHQTLLETKATWKSDVIGGIIMDPQTGAIIAMDGLPSFDPNDYQNVKDPSSFSNQNVSGVYEMGSIIKPITMASALDSGAVTEATTYTDTGFRDLNGYKVRNFDGKPRGPNTHMQTILDKSLNIGIVFLVEQLGQKQFQSYFKKFGIGSETGIDLPGEASGLTKNLDSKVFVDSATAGFGQGIAITPIQTIRALAVLGNGGKLVTPHVVDSIIYQSGETKKIISDEPEHVISATTSEEISRMLVHVVDTALKNGTYKMDHYSIAAKTGTAQMVEPGKGYYEDRYLHSFFGYFPAYDPKYIIFLFHTYPKGAEYASATLTDPFFKLVKFLISYYEVPPDR